MGTRSARILSAIIASSIIFQSCQEEIPVSPPSGSQWLVFTTSNSPLRTNVINGITIDNENKVWLATDSGAFFYIRGAWGLVKDSLVGKIYGIPNVLSISRGYSRSVWFGLNGGGVIRYDRFNRFGLWRRFTEDDGLVSNIVLAIAADRSDIQPDIWCVSVFGVSRFTPLQESQQEGTWRVYNTGNSLLPTNLIRSVAVNFNDNTIWFGTHDGGAVSFDGGSRWIAYPLPEKYNYPIVSIAFDLSNTAWFGKWDGVSVLDVRRAIWKNHYTAENTNGVFPVGIVNAVITDKKSTRWFGTQRGLLRLSDTTWTMFRRGTSPLPSDTVTALEYDVKGNLWIGTAKGVAEFNELGIIK